MNKEKLDSLLASGAITQEEYNEILFKLGGNENGLQKTEQLQDKGQEETKQKEVNTFDEEKLEKLIQAKVDRLTARLGKEKAELQKEVDKLKREKLSDEEIKQLEISEKEKALAERERALLDKENRLYAIKAIKSAQLDDGSDKSLELVDFVMSDDTETIDKRVKAFGDLVRKFVTSEVDKKFKSNGRTPNTGSSGGGNNNPFSKESFNLTEQMRILSENPELAKQLQATAK